jgi:hypothetical protein
MEWNQVHNYKGYCMVCCTSPGGRRMMMSVEQWWIAWQGKLHCSKKPCLSAALSTTNSTWPDPGSNPGRRCRKSATNLLSYSTTKILSYLALRIFVIRSRPVFYAVETEECSRSHCTLSIPSSHLYCTSLWMGYTKKQFSETLMILTTTCGR